MEAINKGKKVHDDLGKNKRQRSPNYPSMSLEKAIERAKEIYDAEKRHDVPIRVAFSHWGFQASSSGGNQCVAALRAYGLINVKGNGDDREISVSDSGYRIILNAPDRTDLIKQAALLPPIHGEIWKKYQQDGLPTDENLRHYLTFDKNFNPDSVDSFIAQLRATFGYGGLTAGAIHVNVADSMQTKDGGSQVSTNINTGMDFVRTAANVVGKKDFPIYLTENKTAILSIPAPLTEDDFRLLKDQIDHSLGVLKATSIQAKQKTKEETRAKDQ